MPISNDAGSDEASSKGHIKGVPFVDKSVNGQSAPKNSDAEDVKSHGGHMFLGETAKDTWYNLRFDNIQTQIRRVHSESTFAYAIALASVVLDIVILAKHFTH
jgi:hypothetical protein